MIYPEHTATIIVSIMTGGRDFGTRKKARKQARGLATVESFTARLQID